MVRYFGPGHTGTVQTIFRLAVERSPDRWDKSAISASERKIWDELREGLRGVEAGLDQILLIEVPKPHDDGLVERYCDVMDACQALRMSLDSRAICANYRDKNGAQHAVPVEFWRGDDECVITALLNGAAYLDVESNDCRLLRLPTSELEKAWPELTSRGSLELNGDETTEQGDAEPPEVGTNDTATTPTKVPSRKVLGVARELKRLYPDGLPTKNFKDLGRDLKVSDSTIKRAFSLNQWSRIRAK